MSIVAGVDGSPISREVVTKALEQARWRDSNLNVVFVSHMALPYTEVAIDWVAVAEAERGAVWSSIADLLEVADVDVERVDLVGYPPDVLVDYANSIDASLLVVGTRGRGELTSLVLGSTSHRAVHLAGCDVLVVKSPLPND